MPVEVRKADRVSAYSKRWQKDSSKDTELDRQSRLSEYTELVNGELPSMLNGLNQAERLPPGYYDGATELYEFGWGR